MVQLFHESILCVCDVCIYKSVLVSAPVLHFPAQKKIKEKRKIEKKSHDWGILTKSAVTRSSSQWAQLPVQELGRKGYSGCFKIIFYNTFSIKGPFHTY